MKVLGIETATTVCGAAVVIDGKVVSVAELHQKNVHAEKLLTLVQQALAQAGCKPEALDGIAVSIGPGSFTGLRIGLSVAKGLVYALGIRLIAVPTLLALAHRVPLEAQRDNGEAILAVLDARRDEVYAQVFRHESSILFAEAEPGDMTSSQLVSLLSGRNVVVIGEGTNKVMQAAVLVGGNLQVREVDDVLNRCTARTVALVGESMLLRGEVEDPAILEPRYIKEFFTKAK